MCIRRLRHYETGDEPRFRETGHGFTNMEIRNARARATISTCAGQGLCYRPTRCMDDLLFVGNRAYYGYGKATGGGIPVCRPWVGADPDGPGRPAHGFVRTRQWETCASESLADGATRVVMRLVDTEATREIWPHPFRLDLEITVGDSLRVARVTHHSGDSSFTIGRALHTYFRVGDIGKVRVPGLDGAAYPDKAADFTRNTQTVPVSVEGELEHIYTGVDGDPVIDDASLARRVRITSRGCSTAVVWNPRVAIAAGMADLEGGDYSRMICAETANAGPETVEILANDDCRLEAEYTIGA